MFEKVNAGHPDKMADRLAGAVVDLVYEHAGGLTMAMLRRFCPDGNAILSGKLPSTKYEVTEY